MTSYSRVESEEKFSLPGTQHNPQPADVKKTLWVRKREMINILTADGKTHSLGETFAVSTNRCDSELEYI